MNCVNIRMHGATIKIMVNNMFTAVCKENLTLCCTHTVSMHCLARCWINVSRLSFISVTCHVRHL